MSILIKVKKGIIIFIMLIFSILAFSRSSYATVVNQTSNFYINDYAEVLSNDTENYIMTSNIELNKKTGAQIVVVTVKSLDGESIENYATELFRKFGIGDKTKNNGVLLLCSTEDRKFRIEVGYGLEGCLTDGKTGRIQDEYIIPYLKNNNYDEGIKNGFNAVLEVVSKEYDVKITGAINPVNTGNDDEENTMYTILITLTLIISIIWGIAQKKFSVKKLIYILIIGIITYIVLRSFVQTVSIIIFNIIAMAVGLMPVGSDEGTSSGGGFSSGGFSGGGGSSRRRRLFEKFLNKED